MSFSTSKMKGTAQPTGAPIHIDSPYALVQKTATPQLPAMLRLKTDAQAQQHLMTPAQVEITICPTTRNPGSSLGGNGSLFPTSILNQTTARVGPDAEADWGKHDLLSAVPDLKASLSNLDKQVRVVGADAGSTQSVLQMHNSILQSHDAVLEKQRSRTRETRKMHLDLQQQHASHKQNTKEYLVMNQGMLESHDMSLKELRDANEEHGRQLQELSHSKAGAGQDSHQFRALSDSHENTREYLTLNQGMMETYHRSIENINATNQTHARLLEDMYTKSDAKSQLVLSESMLRETKFLTQQVDEHKIQLAALHKSNKQLHETIALQQDELDALHDIKD
jgi:hypothetical protein